MASAVTTPPAYGTAEQLEPLVRRVLAHNPSPFTFTGTETYIVGAGDEVAVIDPGPDDADHLSALTAAIGGARVVAICCTHTHHDHSPAAGPLAALTGAPVIGCARLTLVDDGPRADAAFDASYHPDHVLQDGDRVSGQGFTLTAVATPGHTSNHLCYALGESGGAVHRRSRDGLVDDRGLAAGWRHDRLHGLASTSSTRVRIESTTRRTVRPSRSLASGCAR